MNLDQIKNVLRDNGIVGAGGAGFPTYAKLDKKADTIILNCAECECTDKYLKCSPLKF